ncbi:MAG: 4-hydroxy-tetrahydrodipicolinate synthase [Pseudomonadota bacterium]
MTKINGSITALVTPFRNGAVDEDTFAALVERQIKAGTHGLVPVGTTGESATLTDEEHERVIRLCVETAKGRVPVIAGAGANDTAYAISIAKRAADMGADAILAVTGYYNRPNQTGVIAHYEALSKAVDVPIIVYNIPARTTVMISVETMAALSRLPHIAGVKDATGDLARPARERLACADGFQLLSGEDMTAVGYNAMGGQGCISVTSNVVPDLCAQLQEATLAGDFSTALSLQDRLAPLHEALFSDASPGPVKYALSLLGVCAQDVRLPMTPPSEAAQAKIRNALAGLGLLG